MWEITHCVHVTESDDSPSQTGSYSAEEFEFLLSYIEQGRLSPTSQVVTINIQWKNTNHSVQEFNANYSWKGGILL